MFKALGKWLVDSSELTAITERGNALIQALTNTNPKQLHPKIYNGMVQLLKEANDEIRSQGQPALNEFEAAYLGLAFIQKVLSNIGDQGPFTEDTYHQAYLEFDSRHAQHVRQEIKWKRYALG